MTCATTCASLHEDGVDWAISVDRASRLARADAENDPRSSLAQCLCGVDETCFAVGGIKNQIDALSAGEPSDLGVFSMVRNSLASAYPPRPPTAHPPSPLKAAIAITSSPTAKSFT